MKTKYLPILMLVLGGCNQPKELPDQISQPDMYTNSNKDVIEKNRKAVDSFFIALETQNFEIIKDVFAPNGRQLNPYSPEGFPKSFDGSEGIFRQYSGLTQNFGEMKFPRTIYATEDPNFFFVVFKGQISIKSGGHMRTTTWAPSNWSRER